MSRADKIRDAFAQSHGAHWHPTDAYTRAVWLGVGLVVGKLLGVTTAMYLAVRSGIGRLPHDVTWMHIVGGGFVAGIGFTVSLFITQLAFVDPATEALAKLGVFTASVVAALLGVAILRLGPMRRRR